MTFEEWVEQEVRPDGGEKWDCDAEDVWHAAQRAAFERAAEAAKWSFGLAIGDPKDETTFLDVVERIRELEPK